MASYSDELKLSPIRNPQTLTTNIEPALVEPNARLSYATPPFPPESGDGPALFCLGSTSMRYRAFGEKVSTLRELS